MCHSEQRRFVAFIYEKNLSFPVANVDMDILCAWLNIVFNAQDILNHVLVALFPRRLSPQKVMFSQNID